MESFLMLIVFDKESITQLNFAGLIFIFNQNDKVIILTYALIASYTVNITVMV